MDLSLIIVNWNTKKLLEQCLASIYRFTKNVDFEVIVVDNGSKDGSPAMVKKKFTKAKLILNKSNLGFTKANNQGIKEAKGKFIMLLNSDTYLIENSLKKLVEKARTIEGSTLPRVEPLKMGGLGTQLLNEDCSIQQSAGFFPHLLQVFWWMSFIDDLPGGWLLKPFHVDHDSFYQKDRQVDWVTGAAMLVPKEVVEEIGGLDENIFMYGEEVDWCYRIKKAGYKVFFTHATKIIHIGRGSQTVGPNSYIGEYQGVLYFYRKYKSRLSLQIVRLLLKMGALLRIIVFGFLNLACRQAGRRELAKIYVRVFKMA